MYYLHLKLLNLRKGNIYMDKHTAENKSIFGFWVYLMTDLIMFAALFATYAVLRNNTFGGITPRQLFNPPFVLTETLFLLTSSFTCGLALVAAGRNDYKKVLTFLAATFFLGIAFLIMEVTEFTRLFQEGHSFTASASLSAFFTLVGTHGLHITVGLFWISVLFFFLLRRKLTVSLIRKLTLLSLFWHFLDIVWIFIFTIVYLFSGIL